MTILLVSFISTVPGLISEALNILFATLLSLFATLVSYFVFFFIPMALIIFIFVRMAKNAQ